MSPEETVAERQIALELELVGDGMREPEVLCDDDGVVESVGIGIGSGIETGSSKSSNCTKQRKL